MDYLEYYSNYLDKVMTPVQIKLVFLMVLQDFLTGKIETNYFSSIATHFYYDLNKPKDFTSNNEMQKLGNALSSAGEIEFYELNKDKSESNKKMYDAIIKNLKEYYDENKDLLKNYINEK